MCKFWINSRPLWSDSGDWRRNLDICCWFVTIVASWNDCWNSVTIIYDHYRFAIWLLHSNIGPIVGEMALIRVDYGDLWWVETSLVTIERVLEGGMNEKCRLLWVRHLFVSGRRNLGDASKIVRRKHYIWIQIINSKWENEGKGEILYIHVEAWMSKI